MNALIMLAHPEEMSFTASLANAAAQTLGALGWDVDLYDLYGSEFDPVSDRKNFKTTHDAGYLRLQAEERLAAANSGFKPDLATYQAKVLGADLLLLCFPLWWGGMPAILKGWIDRVFASGVLYGGGRQFDHGVMRGKRAELIVTTGNGAAAFDKDNAGTLDDVLFPINRNVFDFVGYSRIPQFVSFAPARMNASERESEIDRLKGELSSLVLH